MAEASAVARGAASGGTAYDERQALARLTLARAEQLTGARSLRRREVPVVAAGLGRPVAGATPARVADAPAHLDTASGAEPVRRTSLVTSERPCLAVPDELAPLLPDGLRRGSTVAVLGSTSLVLTLLAAACAGGEWAALVGQPTVGLLAAAQAGVALARLAVVPSPGIEAPRVVAALLDGVDVVVVGPEVVLTDSDRRRLASRARDRGSVLLSSGTWSGADVVLTARQVGWCGIGSGEGRLRTHDLQVVRSGRGGSGVRRSVELVLPLSRRATHRSGAAEQMFAGSRAAQPASGPSLQLVG